jgi:hypothetical protein
MKFNDFTATTVERQMVSGLPIESFEVLCREAWERGMDRAESKDKSENINSSEQGENGRGKPVRLLGIGVRFVDTSEQGRAMQLELFP